MSEKDYRHILVSLNIEKAADAFDVGKMALESGRLISAVNRLYYTAFYCITALLLLNGQSYVKNSALRAAFHRDLVRPGRVPLEFGELFDRLFKDRQDGDYRPETRFVPKSWQFLQLKQKHLWNS